MNDKNISQISLHENEIKFCQIRTLSHAKKIVVQNLSIYLPVKFTIYNENSILYGT